MNKVTRHTITKQKHSRTTRFQIARCIHGLGKGFSFSKKEKTKKNKDM